jgi:hypothetical protein
MKRKKKVKAVKKARRQAQPNAQTRSKAARANCRHAPLRSRWTANEGAIRKGIRAAGTKDDLGAAGKNRRGRETLPGCAGRERRKLRTQAPGFGFTCPETGWDWFHGAE